MHFFFFFFSFFCLMKETLPPCRESFPSPHNLALWATWYSQLCTLIPTRFPYEKSNIRIRFPLSNNNVPSTQLISCVRIPFNKLWGTQLDHHIQTPIQTSFLIFNLIVEILETNPPSPPPNHLVPSSSIIPKWVSSNYFIFYYHPFHR